MDEAVPMARTPRRAADAAVREHNKDAVLSPVCPTSWRMNPFRRPRTGDEAHGQGAEDHPTKTGDEHGPGVEEQPIRTGDETHERGKEEQLRA